MSAGTRAPEPEFGLHLRHRGGEREVAVRQRGQARRRRATPRTRRALRPCGRGNAPARQAESARPRAAAGSPTRRASARPTRGPRPRSPTTAGSMTGGIASSNPLAHIVTKRRPRSPVARMSQSSRTSWYFRTCHSPSMRTRSNRAPDFESAATIGSRGRPPTSASTDVVQRACHQRGRSRVPPRSRMRLSASAPAIAARLQSARSRNASTGAQSRPDRTNQGTVQRRNRGHDTGGQPTDRRRPVDETGVAEFLGRFVADLGATISAPLVVIGDRLGLYKGLASRWAADLRGARAPHGLRRALRPGMAVQPGRRRLRDLRRPDGTLLDDARAGLLPGGRDEPGVRAGRAAAGHVHDSRLRAHRRALPHRRRARLARAPSRPVPGHGALLPPWLRRQPDDVVATRPRRRGGQTARRRRSGRRGLRLRSVHAADGSRVPGVAVHRLRLPPGVDRRSPQARRGGGARRRRLRRRPGDCPRDVRGRHRSGIPGHRAGISSRSSTACTTCPTRWGPRGMCARRWPTTGPGSSSSRTRARASRTT